LINGAENLKVIPVIDILNGIVVHAVRGKRQEYQPLQSSLCKSVEPLEVSKAFKAFGFSELYIADLDAITGGSVNFQVFNRIAKETGLMLMVDAGVPDRETAEKLLDCGVSKVVIGTETLQSKSFVGEAVRFFGSERVIVSLDLKGDKVLVKLGVDGCKSPMCLLREFKEMGVSGLIVLDLARVGSGEGVNVDFLRKVLAAVPMDVYVGGGVRDIKDLLELRDAGVSGVLVATALHLGKISIEELKKARLL
jgi:phosphoribosylformimino-5-aminoimidazole carboxamide ribotide isomerase